MTHTDPGTPEVPENAPSGPQGRLEGASGHREASEGLSGPQAGADGLGLVPVHNAGPSIRECAEADRRWPLEKCGE